MDLLSQANLGCDRIKTTQALSTAVSTNRSRLLPDETRKRAWIISDKTEIFWIGLGGNSGDVKKCFDQVIQRITSELNVVLNQSRLYKTKPWGPVPQQDFLNQVVEIHTAMPPLALLDYLQTLEGQFGRVRSQEIRWGPRTIDLDILSWTGPSLAMNRLTVPHPLLSDRQFVLKPFAELAPDHRPPGLQKSIKDLLKICPDSTNADLF